MAKIKYSALVSDMRNKLNGSVLSKNRYGSYVRNKVTPVNPQTQYQQEVRQRLGSLSQTWRTLSTRQRNGWSELAKSTPFTDIFGDTKHLDGKAFFIKLNSNLLSIGQATISSAPVLGEIPPLALDSVIASTENDLSVTIDPAVVPAGFTLKVFSTPVLPAQINFVKNRYRDLGAATVVGGAADISAAYADRFGAIGDADEGKRIHLLAVLVATDTGQMGVPVGIEGTVQAV